MYSLKKCFIVFVSSTRFELVYLEFQPSVIPLYEEDRVEEKEATVVTP
jgi:hypothetical protein